MVLVDTSVWIEASRRDGDLAHKVGLENLLDAYEAAWCSPVKLEFMGGSRKEDRKKLAFWFDCIPYRLAEERHWELAKSNAWELRQRAHPAVERSPHREHGDGSEYARVCKG